MQKAVVLLSGGVDSTTLLHHVRASVDAAGVYAVSFIYGQKHARELDMAQWQAERIGVAEHRVLDISFFGEVTAGATALTGTSVPVPDLGDVGEGDRDQPITYVPNRNMTLLSLGAAFAEARGVQDVFYGAQAQDEYGYWDCTPEFVEQINAVLALNRRLPVRVRAPFVDMTKGAVIRMGMALGVDYARTWTCYRGEGVPCRTCPSCVERAKAFEEAGAVDPLE